MFLYFFHQTVAKSDSSFMCTNRNFALKVSKKLLLSAGGVPESLGDYLWRLTRFAPATCHAE